MSNLAERNRRVLEVIGELDYSQEHNAPVFEREQDRYARPGVLDDIFDRKADYLDENFVLAGMRVGILRALSEAGKNGVGFGNAVAEADDTQVKRQSSYGVDNWRTSARVSVHGDVELTLSKEGWIDGESQRYTYRRNGSEEIVTLTRVDLGLQERRGEAAATSKYVLVLEGGKPKSLLRSKEPSTGRSMIETGIKTLFFRHGMTGLPSTGGYDYPVMERSIPRFPQRRGR